MSCTANGDRASAAAARLGLTRLSSKQAFFAGLTLGAAGAGLGALLAAKRQQLASLWRGSIRPRQALTITAPATIKKQAKPIPALTAGPQPKPITGLSPSGLTGARPIPALGASPTTLQPASVQLTTARGEPFLAENSYRVHRADGADSGLAITPHLSEGKEKLTDTWSLTHTATGKRVAGPFANLEQSHRLATQLSPLGWRGPLLSRAKRAEAKRLIEVHRQTLAGKKP